MFAVGYRLKAPYAMKSTFSSVSLIFEPFVHLEVTLRSLSWRRQGTLIFRTGIIAFVLLSRPIWSCQNAWSKTSARKARMLLENLRYGYPVPWLNLFPCDVFDVPVVSRDGGFRSLVSSPVLSHNHTSSSQIHYFASICCLSDASYDSSRSIVSCL